MKKQVKKTPAKKPSAPKRAKALPVEERSPGDRYHDGEPDAVEAAQTEEKAEVIPAVWGNSPARFPKPEEKSTGLAGLLKKSIEAEKRRNNSGAPQHLIVDAKAGTGKTTTMVSGIKNLRGEKPEFPPSEQQAAIWESLAASKGAKFVGGKRIARRLVGKATGRGLGRLFRGGR